MAEEWDTQSNFRKESENAKAHINLFTTFASYS